MNEAGFSRREILLTTAAVLAFLLAGWIWFMSGVADDGQIDTDIDSFESCVEQGHPVMESFPRQCQAPDGRMFSEQVDMSELEQGEYESEGGVYIRISSPREGDTVESPLTIVGEVPGSWSFEASFPVELYDSNGRLITEAPAVLQDDWMTDDLVRFSSTLEFPAQSRGSEGLLVLVKSNASGEPQFDDRLEVPVQF